MSSASTPGPAPLTQRFPDGAVLVLMGAAGSGKTTIGQRLAATLGWCFLDADDFHSPENVRKMAAGAGLHDADRAPWLAELERVVRSSLEERRHVVLACSALRASYRRQLRVDCARVPLVYLKASRELLTARLKARAGHFARDSLVESQLATLEEPRSGIVISADQDPSAIVHAVIDALLVGFPKAPLASS